MLRHIITLLSIGIIISSCDEELFTPSQQQIVVEGWIDAGGYPIVMLSKSLSISKEWQDLENIEDYVIKWGKVTISDGEKEVVLTGKYNSDYYPPYIYTTSEIKGIPGKKYKLTASYKDFYAEAETTIPPVVEVEKIFAEYDNDIYIFKAIINDIPNEHNYYKFFIKVFGRDNMYLSSNLAVIDDVDYKFPAEIPLNIGNSMLYNKPTRDFTLKEENAVLIKFAQIDSVAYNFWNDYKNAIDMGRNPLYRFTDNPYSNIKGGLGYWVGYGATEYFCYSLKHYNPIKITK